MGKPYFWSLYLKDYVVHKLLWSIILTNEEAYCIFERCTSKVTLFWAWNSGVGKTSQPCHQIFMLLIAAILVCKGQMGATSFGKALRISGLTSVVSADDSCFLVHIMIRRGSHAYLHWYCFCLSVFSFSGTDVHLVCISYASFLSFCV